MAAKVVEPLRTGQSTMEYVVVWENFGSLVDHLKPILSEVVANFVSCSLIPRTQAQVASSHDGDPCRKASDILKLVLSAIECDSSNFSTFVSALKNVHLSDVALRLVSLVRERSIPTGEPINAIPFRDTHNHDRHDGNVSFQNKPSLISRRVLQHDSSDSVVNMTATNTDGNSLVRDSAYEDQQSSFAAIGDHQESRQDFMNENVSEPLDTSTSPLKMKASGNGVRFPVEQSGLQANSDDVSSNEMVLVPSGRVAMFEPGSEAYTRHHQYLMDIAKLEALMKRKNDELESLRNTHDLNESKILDLQKQMSEMAKENEKVANEKDKIIKRLRIDKKYRDELIRRLKSEKAEVEARIAELRKSCAAALKNQKRAEERAAAVEEEFKEKEASLNKQLEELREKEERAQLELQVIKTKLAEANCTKLKEMQELKDRNHELEKAEILLRSELEKRELAKDKELAEKKAELLETQKELAESKQKCSEMELEALKRQFCKQKLEAKNV